MDESRLVIIGGSGVTDSPTFKDAEWKMVDTGIEGYSNGVVHYQQSENVAFIPRHGRNHEYSPSRVNYKANVMAAHLLGAKAIIATSAVGSFRDSIPLGSLVVASDYIDLTGRDDNFFGVGFTVHAGSKPAFSQELREILTRSGKSYFLRTSGAVYCCIPGDRFGTVAEGRLRSQPLGKAPGPGVVGMTVCPEAALAQQAGLHYAVACFPVDMDTDANHEGQTLEVMRELSKPECVPAYIDEVVRRTLDSMDRLKPLDQLEGNIIDAGGPPDSAPDSIRRLATRLKELSCK